MKEKTFQPMLAERKSLHTFEDQVKFPVYVGPKLDGIRCPVLNGVAVSRSLTPIPNPRIAETLSRPEFNGLDGEIIVGPPNAENVFNRTQSYAMSGKLSNEPFGYYVFDDFTSPTRPYEERRDAFLERVHQLQKFVGQTGLPVDLRVVHSDYCTSLDAVYAKEAEYLEYGFEGAIVRTRLGTYKFGRSTAREQGMLKLKRFMDGEAEIIGFEELMRNNNELQRDELGHAKRSSAKEGLVGGDTLGAFIVRDVVSNVEFNIGMFKGLDAETKTGIWLERDSYMGKIVKYQYFAIGVKEKPRHPKFIGFRDKADM